MTLRQHEIHADSDYDEDDDGPVAGADGSLSQILNSKEPFENLPRPSSHRSVPQHEIHADDYDEDGDGQSREVKQPFGNLPRLQHSVLLTEQRSPKPPQHEIHADGYDEDVYGQSAGDHNHQQEGEPEACLPMEYHPIPHPGKDGHDEVIFWRVDGGHRLHRFSEAGGPHYVHLYGKVFPRTQQVARSPSVSLSRIFLLITGHRPLRMAVEVVA